MVGRTGFEPVTNGLKVRSCYPVSITLRSQEWPGKVGNVQ